MEQVNNTLSYFKELALQFGPKVLYAAIVLILGLWIIKLIVRLIQNFMVRRKVEGSLRSFLGSFISLTLKVLLVITAAGMLGIEVTSFIAIIGAAGLAVGLALSGTLQNFAGGVMILIFRPYKTGDFIEAQGYSGVVSDIQIFNTILKTPDNKAIIIPNGGLSTSSITNYSTETKRRVDMNFSISYESDIDHTKAVIERIIITNEKILTIPHPFIAVAELADSAVKMVVRVWVNTENYWDVYFGLQETVKKTFDKEKIKIPYPQNEVHLIGNN